MFPTHQMSSSKDQRIVPCTLDEQFQVFAQADDTKSQNGRKISFRNVRRWLMAADILGSQDQGGMVSFTDVQDAFARIAKKRERLDSELFCHMLELLARKKRVDTQVMVDKLKKAPRPRGASLWQIYDRQHDER